VVDHDGATATRNLVLEDLYAQFGE
jgi:hypothetical protein